MLVAMRLIFPLQELISDDKTLEIISDLVLSVTVLYETVLICIVYLRIIRGYYTVKRKPIPLFFRGFVFFFCLVSVGLAGILFYELLFTHGDYSNHKTFEKIFVGYAIVWVCISRLY